MKVEFNKKRATNTAVLGLGAFAGGLSSRGLMGIAPSEMKTPIIKGAIAATTLLLAGSIQGDDNLANFTKGVALGVTVEQGNSAIGEAIAPSIKADATTSTEKFLKAVAGMKGVENSTYQPVDYNIPSNMWEDVMDESNAKTQTIARKKPSFSAA
ncbi:hypothetical protein [Tenacibaculum maritimum]|uniref:hypothetical protein n=1 Tax=Tenacibaculum maritimum TaxID=107401 RepID=UPI0012E593EC|nr:hypothetical protein [Tenacibaculum maritimum]CAA0215623.1 conserved hypothetical protein [Tenacibaculum maritimum]